MTGSQPTASTGPAGPAEPAGPTAASRLLQSMLTDLAGLVTHLGGDWTAQDGTGFHPARRAFSDEVSFYAEPCIAAAAASEPPSSRRFRLVLQRGGAADPRQLVERAEAWGAGHHHTVLEAGTGPQIQQGDLFTTLRGPHGGRLVVTVSTGRAQVSAFSACSEDDSMLDFVNSGERRTSPGDRFAPPTSAPDPASTRLGISG
ncbi:hypothetical protein AB0333_07030 [Citricoccus sp. NPDC079358]|uniref:hypothetical protein n=1 Tax=Citricoccus sp. NPDC079358 TaxID=3154653 RepID=UPI00344F3148